MRRRDWLLGGLQAGWLASLTPAAARLADARRWPLKYQQRILLDTVRKNARSAYGRAHRFAHVGSIEDFQRAVPVTDYDALSPWLDRVCRGERAVLTVEDVRLLERSGGSTTSSTKLIPYTGSLLAEFGRATNPWLWSLHRRFPSLLGTSSYWSLSPVVQGPRRTAGGIPIGMDNDTEYFGPLRRFVVAQTMAVSPSVAHAPSFAAWQTETLVELLCAQNLGLISVWSPTFLTVLMQGLARDFEIVAARLPRERARLVERAWRRETGWAKQVWPRLSVISCWADGPSARLTAPLRRWFEGVSVEPKGLLATEGVISVPVGEGPGAQLALTSHFLEFVDLDEPGAHPRLAHELRVGGHYTPLLTTGGGLYRYRLKDIVECTAPLRIRFVEKLDRVADLTGEKIHVAQVEVALAEAAARFDVPVQFALLAPVTPAEGQPPYYCLYLESPVDDASLTQVARAVEHALLEGHAYRYSRDLGQLAQMRVQRVADGATRYLRALLKSGVRAGDIKPSLLDARPVFASDLGEGAPLSHGEGPDAAAIVSGNRPR